MTIEEKIEILRQCLTALMPENIDQEAYAKIFEDPEGEE